MDDGEPQSDEIEPALARAIIENATDYAILTVDARGVITSWSRGAERILQYRASDVVGRDFSMLFLEPDRRAGTPAIELQKAMQDGRAEDTRWHIRADGEVFWANGVTMRVDHSPLLVKVMRDETRAKRAEDQRVLLLNELNHRIKNTLATVQAIVDQTLRSVDVDPAVREDLASRLIALAEAHNVLVEQSWAGADLMAIVASAVAPHETPGVERFEVSGPPTWLSSRQAVATALVLHELTTNAIKHGALSVPAGRVSITWNLAYDESGGRSLTLLWRERGGPPVSQPTRRGFGARLLARSFEGTEGRVELDFEVEGVSCVLEIPLSQAEETMMAVSGDPSKGTP